MSRTATTPKRQPETAAAQADTPRFEHIEALIDGEGDITIGRVGPIPCAATAADEDQALAMLVRREAETFVQLLARLDEAIRMAYDEQTFIDEINAPR